MAVNERLNALGITLPKLGKPVGNYVNAVQTGNLLYLAGKGPSNEDGSTPKGKVGRDFTTEQGYQYARTVGLQLIAAMQESLGNLDRVKRIVKVLGMVNAEPDFGEQPKVINGCSDLFVEVFGDKGRHARSAVGMGSLPMGIPVEIEVIVEVEKRRIGAAEPPPMQREIGRTGVRVYPIGLGAMPLSLAGRPSEATALAVIKAALDAGVDFIDTANSYCRDDTDVGHNERLIARCVGKLGIAHRMNVATKGGLVRPRGAWNSDARPERLKAACEQSLRDLGVEQIFLYQLHAPDPRVPYAESVGALAELQLAGKIRHVGVSNVDTGELAQALRVCRVESVQNRCNPTDPGDFKNGVVEACAHQHITYIAYSPVGGHHGHKSQGRNRVLSAIGKAHGVSAYQVALAWLLAKGPHVLPIPGASKVHSITDSAAAAHLTLSPDELRQVDALGR